MKKIKGRFNKILSVMLALIIVLSTFSGLSLVSAATPYSYFNKVADAATLDGWKAFFGSNAPSTENAGGVWTDKSVFVDNTAFTGLTDAYGDAIVPTVAEDSFLVALSAIASNKSIVGYSHIPTDTVLVLDISGSMGPDNNDAVGDLVLAANAALTELLELNNNNRVGVVLYSAEYDQGNDEHYYTLLPIDRYTATGTVTYDNGTADDTTDDRIVNEYLISAEITEEIQVGGRPGRPGSTETRVVGEEIAVADGVKNSENANISTDAIEVVGGTFIQGGLKAAADLFKGKADANDTIVAGDGFQGGTQRKPVLVLMSDGAPTYATTDYMAPGDPNKGNGQSTNEAYAFLTQLTGAYLKNQITEYYNDTEALFYTLGLGVGDSAVAQSVLDPQNSTPNITTYWDNYNAAADKATVEITNNISVEKTNTIDDIVYVNDYFEAETRSDLFDAFDDIVNEIIIQSLYRPTLVENNNAHMEGYIEFIDDIGNYMEVQQIEGIMIGDKLFTGEKLCENFTSDGGDLGTVANPNALGDNFIWSVQQRLGIEDVTVARRLVTLAYEHGQLSYTDDDNYSNYIGWYADKDGNYIGFWDESHTYSMMPDNAAYINKSYGMLGEIKDGLNASDLMYVSIQVHTEIVPNDRFGLENTDTIMPGHAQLIYRIPASLIPVVTYDVELEGTGYDNAKNIKMTINDAEPLRLLFEVGLRNDINEYNIEEALGENNRTADGKYVFYTNEYSVQQFDHKNNTDTNYVAPTEAINTIAYFEPNYANERYYYAEPTPVFVKQGSDYVKYSSDTKPVADDGNEYYRQINVFELTGNGNEAVLNKVYERISDTALGRVDQSDTNGGWNIRKETIHRVYDEIETIKTAQPGDVPNPTGTLNYSYFPTVEHIEGTHYYADAILGNNGKLTVTPATGIRITKNVDETLAGTTEDFTFSVDIGDVAGNYSVVYRDSDGNFVDNNEVIALGADGKGTITLKAGWSAYIVGIDAGLDYSVEEVIPSGADYKVASSTNATGIVTANHLADVQFVNTLSQSGNLVIAKRITHPFATTPDSINAHTFKFDVTLTKGGETYPDAQLNAHYSTAPNQIFTLNVVNNKIEGIELHGDQAIVVEVKEGWSTVVTENQTDMPDGFALDTANTVTPANNTIATNSNVLYLFVNDYKPDTVSADITINASKELTGRPWNNDTFTFALYRYDPHIAQYIELGRETINRAGGFGTTLTNLIKAESFDKVGTYHYSIREIVPADTFGVTYDAISRDIDIVVTDTDTDGKLEIAEVRNANHTTVTNNGGAYTVDADKFVNTYKASGIAEVIIQIDKTVETPTGITYSPEGFEFGFYDESGNLASPLYTTDADGKVQFVFAYNADGVDYQNDKVIKYVIKETNTGLGGITYAQDIPVTVTVKDNLDGTISATTDIANVNNGVAVVDVTNIYTVDDVDVTLEATKTIDGRNLVDKEFNFALKDVDNDKVVQSDAQNDADGNVVFNTLTFDTVGTYNYLVYENEADGEGVKVDTTEYAVQVIVTDNGNGQLEAEVKLNGATITGTTANAIVFENKYTAASVDVTLEATKTITGRDLRDGEFKFDLYNADNNTVAQEDVELVLQPDGKGKITFADLTFDTAGTYNYVVYEDEVDGNGVAVDTTIHEIEIIVSDNGKGNLEAIVKVNGVTVTGTTANAIVFENKYTAASVDVTLEATKTITGRDLRDGEFKFALKDVDNDKVIQDDATNDADGKVVFDALTFDTVGSYNYLVYENEVDGKGVTIDQTRYAVTITVTDNGKGNLVASVKVDGTDVADSTASVIAFENIYKAETTDIVIAAQKKLEGRDIEDGEFEFELWFDGKCLETVQNDADGKVIFENVAIDDAGEFIFTVNEVKGNAEGVTYDETVYTVTVTVSDNLDGTYNVDYIYDIEGEEVEEIVFNNKYTEPTPDPEPTPEPEPEPEPEPSPAPQPESPKTGDNTNLAAWLAVVFISGAMIFATGKKIKRLSK